MPRYDYKCTKCDKVEEHIHPMSDNPLIKCSECNAEMKRIISHNIAGFAIKGGSEAIHWREKQKRLKKREVLGKKQKERYGDGPKVAPNIAGVMQDSWSDCQKLAKEAGMNHESYQSYVEKEKKNNIKIYTGR
jgi:putative FmdB family regulatory protein